jgi:hypothetical protein
MATPQPQPTNTEANIRKAAEAIAEVLQMKQEFIRCHEFVANRTARLVELLGHAESRGYLLKDSLTLVNTTYWLQHIDWQTKFLSMALSRACPRVCARAFWSSWIRRCRSWPRVRCRLSCPRLLRRKRPVSRVKRPQWHRRRNHVRELVVG